MNNDGKNDNITNIAMTKLKSKHSHTNTKTHTLLYYEGAAL